MPFQAVIVLFLVLASTAWGAEYEAFPDLNRENPAALREATRVLEEEVKLAAKPQTYLLLDLPAGAVRIKGRGVDLHRIAIQQWTASAPQQLTGAFRLTARPPVVRRKIDPSATTEQDPIALADMPTDYQLSFTPALRMKIQSTREEGVVQRTLSSAADLWQRLKAWGASYTHQPSPPEASITLKLSVDQAQSLAWSTVDGMALVIRRLPDQ